MTEAEGVLENIDTLRQKGAPLMLKYPDLLRNSTLAMLLYLLDYDGIDLREDDLDRAAEGDLVNLTSLHRAITATKRDSQTPEQRRRSFILKKDWTDALCVDREEAL